VDLENMHLKMCIKKGGFNPASLFCAPESSSTKTFNLPNFG